MQSEMQRHDIGGREDIEGLVAGFYSRVRQDELLANIFAHSVGGDWPAHEGRVCDFWETVLLGRAKFKSASLLRHQEVDQICPLCPFHFERWCRLFEATVDDSFAGEQAEKAKMRAWAMSAAMQRQIDRGRCPFADPAN